MEILYRDPVKRAEVLLGNHLEIAWTKILLWDPLQRSSVEISYRHLAQIALHRDLAQQLLQRTSQGDLAHDLLDLHHHHHLPPPPPPPQHPHHHLPLLLLLLPIIIIINNIIIIMIMVITILLLLLIIIIITIIIITINLTIIVNIISNINIAWTKPHGYLSENTIRSWDARAPPAPPRTPPMSWWRKGSPKSSSGTPGKASNAAAGPVFRSAACLGFCLKPKGTRAT